MHERGHASPQIVDLLIYVGQSKRLFSDCSCMFLFDTNSKLWTDLEHIFILDVCVSFALLF